MMPGDLPAKYALNRLSLGYDDPVLEAEYQAYQPPQLIRSIRPLIIVLIPIIGLGGLLDYLSVTPQSLVPWQACLVLMVVLLILLAIMASQAAARLVQPALLVTFVLFGVALLTRIASLNELRRYFPGYFILIMMTHFVGMRFTHGLAAALLLVSALLAVVIDHHLGIGPIFDLVLFLVPGYAIAATAGYTMERQRRRLFAQLKMLEQERQVHEQMALHDPLTDLPNRSLLRERMQQSVARSRRQHGQFAVLFVDLDDFKTVNDTHGHACGDRVLRQIAVNLQSHVRGEDTVARLGGDEFVILSEHIEDEAGARTTAERIQAAVSEHIHLDTGRRGGPVDVQVTCSIGIALCPRDGDTLEQLISRADEAMYNAKRGGKGNSRFFHKPGTQSPDEEPAGQ